MVVEIQCLCFVFYKMLKAVFSVVAGKPINKMMVLQAAPETVPWVIKSLNKTIATVGTEENTNIGRLERLTSHLCSSHAVLLVFHCGSAHLHNQADLIN